MRRILSLTFCLIGVISLLLASFLLWERYRPHSLSFTSYAAEKPSESIVKSVKKPVWVSIPSLAISLPLIPSVITQGQWETTTDGVSYLQSSPVPGAIGNSILYGHNFPTLLGNLYKIKPGAKIIVIFNDSSQIAFTVTSTSLVLPNNISILQPTLDRRITIYTCAGLLDSKRFVAVALAKE